MPASDCKYCFLSYAQRARTKVYLEMGPWLFSDKLLSYIGVASTCGMGYRAVLNIMFNILVQIK